MQRLSAFSALCLTFHALSDFFEAPESDVSLSGRACIEFPVFNSNGARIGRAIACNYAVGSTGRISTCDSQVDVAVSTECRGASSIRLCNSKGLIVVCELLIDPWDKCVRPKGKTDGIYLPVVSVPRGERMGERSNRQTLIRSEIVVLNILHIQGKLCGCCLSQSALWESHSPTATVDVQIFTLNLYVVALCYETVLEPVYSYAFKFVGPLPFNVYSMMPRR